MLLETYTSLSGEALKNSLPKFLKIVKEVTGCPDYSMFNLSLKEDWSNTKKFCYSLHGKKICKCSQLKTTNDHENESQRRSQKIKEKEQEDREQHDSDG